MVRYLIWLPIVSSIGTGACILVGLMVDFTFTSISIFGSQSFSGPGASLALCNYTLI